VQNQNKQGQEIKVEKDLLPVAVKESIRVISKTIPSWNKGNMRVLFGKPKLTHVGRKHFSGGPIHKHA
jgi:hypothetical protein